jgi:hypothetical protein
VVKRGAAAQRRNLSWWMVWCCFRQVQNVVRASLPCGPKDVTGHVLSLLNRRYLLAQSDEFLAPPEARVR